MISKEQMRQHETADVNQTISDVLFLSKNFVIILKKYQYENF